MKQGEEKKEEEEGVEGVEGVEEEEKLDGEMGIFYNPSKIMKLNVVPLNNYLWGI